MITIFRGYQRKDGSFPREGTGEIINYDNTTIFYLVKDVPGVVGDLTGKAKIMTKNLHIYGAKTLDELIYKPVALAMDPSSDPANPRVTDIYLLSALGVSDAAVEDK